MNWVLSAQCLNRLKEESQRTVELFKVTPPPSVHAGDREKVRLGQELHNVYQKKPALKAVPP
jgi:hypothetical protein